MGLSRPLLSLITITLSCATPPVRAQPVAADHAQQMAKGVELFKSDVRQILLDNCSKCHGGANGAKGGLDLSTREGMLDGGKDGKVVVTGDASKSRLLKLVRHEEEPHMPAKGEKLSDAAVAKIAAWIDAGAPYDKPLLERKGNQRPKGIGVTEADRKFWSFAPLMHAEPPKVKDEAWPKNAIDRFLLAKLEEKNLAPDKPADRRKLIRRASLDLLGLPPKPEEVEAFVNDADPDAYPKLIDRLLASPHYGERYARHWLDLARFAESHGYEQDYDRPYAFHFRDFVIKALNDDLPYDTFVKWQIAGDEIAPENPEAMKATGFLGAGTHATQITANQAEKERYDELDDMASTVGTAMLGMTVGCARCHDHKFDPILSSDYYRLIATFTTTVRSDQEIDLEPQKTKAAREAWAKQHEPLVAARDKYEREELPAKLDAWLSKGEMPATPAWLVLEPKEIKSSGGATFVKEADGSYLATGADADFDTYTLVLPTKLSGITGLRIEALSDPSLPHGGPGRADNGNIALTDVRLQRRPLSNPDVPASDVKLKNPRATFEQSDTLAAKRTIDGDKKSGWAVDPQFGKDHAIAYELASPINDGAGTLLTLTLDHQNNVRHNIGRLRISVTTSKAAPGLGDTSAPALLADVAKILSSPRDKLSESDRAALMAWFRTSDDGWKALDAPVQQSLAREPTSHREKVMICSEGVQAIRLHTQGPDFYEKTFVLTRGDLSQKQGEAVAGFPIVLTRAADADTRWRVQEPAGSKLSGRRTALANWITDVDAGAGHLLARVIVNRLWQHHFGRGIVATPSDFGAQGERPTHPELLDYLAAELIRNRWQLKPIHRLMMTSSAYMESSDYDANSSSVDPDNRLLWRSNVRRLEAEAIRDSMLSVAGTLDERMYGPGSLDEAMNRRSIYFTTKRSQMIPILQLFDAPDSLTGLGQRSSTTVAPQALAMMNNPRVLGYAKAFAKRLLPAAKDGAALPEAIRQGYELALGRAPTSDELSDAVAFVNEQVSSYKSGGKADALELGLADFCQAVLSLNEFVFVD